MPLGHGLRHRRAERRVLPHAGERRGRSPARPPGARAARTARRASRSRRVSPNGSPQRTVSGPSSYTPRRQRGERVACARPGRSRLHDGDGQHRVLAEHGGSCSSRTTLTTPPVDGEGRRPSRSSRPRRTRGVASARTPSTGSGRRVEHLTRTRARRRCRRPAGTAAGRRRTAERPRHDADAEQRRARRSSAR